MANKFQNDSAILKLQNKREELGRSYQEAAQTGCSDELLMAIMDEQDAVSAQLARLGCHPRAC